MKNNNSKVLFLSLSTLLLYFILPASRVVNPAYFILGITLFLSFSAFNNDTIAREYIFDRRAIKENKEYYRFISHGFLHADVTHLFFNLFSLYSFAPYLNRALQNTLPKAGFIFIFIYLSSIVFSSLFDYINKKGEYYALGASGAISSIISIVVVLFPELKLGIIFLPIMVPGPLFLALFMGLSYYLSKGNSRIGHMAHLSGAVYGLFIGFLIKMLLSL